MVDKWGLKYLKEGASGFQTLAYDGRQEGGKRERVVKVSDAAGCWKGGVSGFGSRKW